MTDNVCVNDAYLVFNASTGCFSLGGSGIRAVVPNQSVATYADNRTLTFRASKSSPIYGKSETVQPNSIILNVWKRIE